MPLTQKQRDAYKALQDKIKRPAAEMRELATAAGMLPSAIKAVVEECSGDGANNWDQEDAIFYLIATGETMQQVIQRWQGSKGSGERSHLWAAPAEPSIIEEAQRAFGAKPTNLERATFYKKHGPDEYYRYMEMFGASETNLKPGKCPGEDNESGEDKPRKPSGKNNPWSDDFPGGPNSDAALAQRASIMRGLGLKKATEMAASAGKTVTGAPLRK